MSDKVELIVCESCGIPFSEVPWQTMPTLGQDEVEEVACLVCGARGCSECFNDELCCECEDCEDDCSKCEVYKDTECCRDLYKVVWAVEPEDVLGGDAGLPEIVEVPNIYEEQYKDPIEKIKEYIENRYGMKVLTITKGERDA